MVKKILWAPWRVEYILMKRKKGCLFCKKQKEKNDEKNFILYRGSKNFVILNVYPYNTGHLMIAPYRHVEGIESLSKEELEEHFSILQNMVKGLKSSMNAKGFNIGLNIGRCAGAGEKHLHTHIVPRWDGDTNFMPVVSSTKVIPESLKEVYLKLKKYIT